MAENMKLNHDSRLKPSEIGGNSNPQPPPPPHQKCPRCDSNNTKFCYFNNYSITQPRYFCKSCRRYWTHGGALRNVPVGGGCRKNKRVKTSSSQPSSSSEATQAAPSPPPLSSPPVLVPGQGSFYPGGTLLSSLTAFQSINQPPVAASGSAGRFGTNLSLLQGVNISTIRPQVPTQQFNTEYLPVQRGLMSSWSHGVMNRAGASTSAGAGGNFWGGAVVDDGNRQLSSYNPNWPSDDVANNHPGFGPSQ